MREEEVGKGGREGEREKGREVIGKDRRRKKGERGHVMRTGK